MDLRYDFIGVGGLGMDLTLGVDSLPLTDAKVPAQWIGHLPGGFIANATCVAARLGLRAAFAGWVGDDLHGTLLRQDFERWGVHPAGLVTLPAVTTAFTIVITDQRGQRCILLPESPIYRWPLAQAQRELIAQARVIYSYPRDPAWCEHLIEAARRSGGVLALDVESAHALSPTDLRQVIAQARLVFLSRESLALLGADSIADFAAPDRWVILTDGARGAYGAAGGASDPIFVQARRVSPVVDTTGAGDTFHAAAIAAYLDGAALDAALVYATAAAALKIQHRGARGGLPTRAQIAALLGGNA